jgi:hypothetical protein
MPTVRRFWPVLAVVAGVALIFFEYRRAHGVTADNAFWLFVGALIVVLGLVDLFQKRPGAEPPEGPRPPLGPPD